MERAESNIDKVVALKNHLRGKEKDYLNKYLANAPMWLLDSFQVVHMKKNNVFIKENREVDMVYILVEGIVKAIDYRIFGIAYDYMWFYPVKVFGSMEILLELEKYMTTLITVTPCKMLVVSKSKFEEWMRKDINTLLLETKTLGTYLLEQARKERVFLFVQGIDRVILLFMQLYEQMSENKRCVIKLTRQDIADCSGLSIKTINRSVKKMEEDGYIGRDGNRIIILEDQYLKMKHYISPIVEQ
ncbi:Crp/Fnr family transcriptional regulator [Cellulosilyticum sp. I15G10I2]|uniref:Crp/Fnr family transcriptional regulator n=1 Tax=Cellulosilyticum sp. I15G10I2 TaxID=1892843 RepID=UPI00085C914A|nr:Crp/Fnr family transcriptional regulator [Cellulosilyticum sp. I15G10I2]